MLTKEQLIFDICSPVYMGFIAFVSIVLLYMINDSLSLHDSPSLQYMFRRPHFWHFDPHQTRVKSVCVYFSCSLHGGCMCVCWWQHILYMEPPNGAFEHAVKERKVIASLLRWPTATICLDPLHFKVRLYFSCMFWSSQILLRLLHCNILWWMYWELSWEVFFLPIKSLWTYIEGVMGLSFPFTVSECKKARFGTLTLI